MKTLYNNDAVTNSVLLLSLIQFRQWAQNNYTIKMNSSETDSHIVMSRSHYSENFLHNSEFSTKYKTLSSLNETAAKEDTKKVYALHCHCINLYFNEKNQIWLYKKALLKELIEISVALLWDADIIFIKSQLKIQNASDCIVMIKWLNYLHKWQCRWSCLQI